MSPSPTPARTLSITIDLDSPSEYAALHGVPLAAEDPHLVYRGPLRRFFELCQSAGGPGTVFSISRDVCGPAAARLVALAQQGVEIASHSHLHDYGLSKKSRDEIVRELRRSQAFLRQEIGIEVEGFRAPGYLLSPTLLEAVERCGFRYDSSLLPSPPYYLAKLAAVSVYRLLRRGSRAVVGDPRALLAPTQPFHPGHDPHRPGHRDLVELPITVSTPARLPFTGAAFLLAPDRVRRAMLAAAADLPCVIINLHGMDLVDPEGDSLPASLAARQPELRRPVRERVELLTRMVRQLASGREVLTCAAVARRYRAESGRGAVTEMPASG